MDQGLFYQISGERLPRVKYADKVTVEPPHVHIRRRTEEFILYYVLSGEMHLQEGNRPFVLKPNELLILDPRYEHFGTRATACTYFYVHFYCEQMTACSEENERMKEELIGRRLASLKTYECDRKDEPPSPLILPKAYAVRPQAGAGIRLVELLHMLRESHHNHMEHYRFNTSLLFGEFLIALSRELTSGCLSDEPSVSAARSARMIHDLLSFFQSSYASEITGKRIEETCRCSFDYLNRVFKKTTGTTIFAYLSELRISKAKQLLSDGTVKKSEVAEMIGFRDVYYFSKVFKKLTGMTPGAYSRINSRP